MEENVLKIYFSGTTEPFKRKFEQNMILCKIEIFSAAWKFNQRIQFKYFFKQQIFIKPNLYQNEYQIYPYKVDIFMWMWIQRWLPLQDKIEKYESVEENLFKMHLAGSTEPFKKEIWLSLTFTKCLFIVQRENSRRPPPQGQI